MRSAAASKQAAQGGSGARAVQLVKPVRDSFQVVEEGLEQLRALGPDARIKVLSIAGVGRTGKSTVLEMLADVPDAFKIADGTDPCTQGINMIVTPIKGKKNSYLVLMDSEGIEAQRQSDQYMAQLFSMCVLFSCLFVFNHKGFLDARAFDELSLVATIIADISSDASRQDDLTALNTRLLFLLRDFDTDQLAGKSTAKYLSEWLDPADNPDGDPVVAEQNTVRRSIKQLFRKTDCLTMAPPARKTTKIKERELDPEFRADLDRVKKFVDRQIEPFSVNGKTLNGPDFADFVKQAVSKVNDGTPLLTSMVQTLARQHNTEMIRVLIDKYEDAINKLGAVEDLKTLEVAHTKASELAVAELQQGLRGDDRARLDANATLTRDLNRLHNHAVRALIPALNEKLKLRCLGIYTREMSRTSTITDMAQYHELHQTTVQTVRRMLVEGFHGTVDERQGYMDWLDREIGEAYTRGISSMEALFEQRKRDSLWGTVIGGGGLASGVTLMATAHPFIGAAAGLVGAAALLRNFIPKIPGMPSIPGVGASS